MVAIVGMALCQVVAIPFSQTKTAGSFPTRPPNSNLNSKPYVAGRLRAPNAPAPKPSRAQLAFFTGSAATFF
jgi:hypothetical protein